MGAAVIKLACLSFGLHSTRKMASTIFGRCSSHTSAKESIGPRYDGIGIWYRDMMV